MAVTLAGSVTILLRLQSRGQILLAFVSRFTLVFFTYVSESLHLNLLITAHPLDGRPQKEVQVGPDKLEVVASFCCLGDMLSAAGGCELSTTTRVKTAWKKFKDLLPVLSSRHLSFKTRGRVYSSCVRSAMLHSSESWPLTKPNLQRLQRNDKAMIRQICNVRPQDIVNTRSNELLARLGIEDLVLILLRLREGVGLGGPR